MLVCLCLLVFAEALSSLVSECCFMFATHVEHMIQHLGLATLLLQQAANTHMLCNMSLHTPYNVAMH